MKRISVASLMQAMAVLATLAVMPASAQFSAIPSSISFPAPNPDPNLAFFTLFSANPTVVTFNLSTSTSTGQQWLTAESVAGNQTTAQIRVRVNPAGLGVGTYSGNVIVTSPTGQFAQLSVPVTFLVGQGSGSAFTLSPSALALSSTSNGATASAAVTLSSTTFTTYSTSVTTTTGQAWLSVSPSSTGTSSQSHQFTVFANPAGLANGQYSGTVIVSAAGQTQSLGVAFSVGQTSGSGTASPSSLSFSALAGAVAGQQTLQYTSSSAVTVTAYTTSTPISWLSVTPSLTGPTTFATFTVTANAAGLTAGNTYQGNIVLSPSSGTATTVPVTFTVTSSGTGGTMTISPSPVSLTYAQGGLAPTSLLTVSGVPSGATLVGSTSATWISVAGSSLVGTGTYQVNCTTNPSSLGAGPYSAVVTIQAQSGGVTVATAQVTVNLTVSGTGGGTGTTLSPSQLSFSYTAGSGLLPASQSLTLSSPSNVVYSITPSYGTGPSGWFTLNTFSGVTTSTVTSLTVSIPTLPTAAAGTTYQGSVMIVANGVTTSATITLSITSSGGTGGVSLSPSQMFFSYTPGGNAPPSQTVTLSTPASTTFTASASGVAQGIAWLTAGPISGTTFTTTGVPSAILSIAVQNYASLPIGTYQGTVTVATPLGTATLNVTLNVGTGGGGTTSTLVSPSQLTFTFQGSTATPPVQLLTVNAPNGISSQFTATVNTTPVSTWLSVNQTNGPAPGVIAVSVNPHTLPVGTYSGTVTVTVASSGTPITIPVTLYVQSTPVLRTNLNSVTFNYQIGSSSTTQTVNVDLSNTGSSALTVIPTTQVQTPAGGNWLSVLQASLTTQATATVSVNASGLAAGTYTGFVNFAPSGGATVQFPVTLIVSSAPLLTANTLGLNFSTPTGTTPVQQQQTFLVSTTSTSATVVATAVAMNGGSWLSVSPNSPLATPTNFTVTVNPAGLAQDTFYGVIIVNTTPTGQTGNAPILIPVVYSNGGTSGGGGTGAFSVTPASLTFTQIQNGVAPAAQSLSVTAGTSTSFTTSVSTTTGQSWLSVVSSTGATPGTIQVAVNASGLALGNYSGFVVVSPLGGNPTVIPVSLSVITPPTMTVSPTALVFDYQVGGSLPAAQTINVGATAGASAALVNFNATFNTSSGGSWLAVSPASGATPGTLTVSVTPTGLALGSYTGTITITSVATNSPLVIPVQFTVRQRTQILAQIADGSNWKTSITLVNLDTAAASFTLRFYDDNGNPLGLLTDALAGRSSVIEGTIPVGGVRTINTLGVDTALAQGWVELSTTRTLNGTAVFRQRGDRGDQEAGVPITSSVNRFVLSFDNVDNFVTSMAIVNTNAGQTVVANMIIRDEQGNQLGTDSLVMAGRSHQAFALPDRLTITRGRRGTVEFFSNGADITALGLRFNPGGAFTSFPVLAK